MYPVEAAALQRHKRGSGISNAPVAGILHNLNILVQSPLVHLEWWGGPLLPATLKLVCRYLEVDCIFDGIHRDNITVVDKCNGATYLSFRDNVANDEPMGALQCRRNVLQERPGTGSCGAIYSPSTKSSVSHTGHVLAKPGAHNQTCGFEHFWHA